MKSNILKIIVTTACIALISASSFVTLNAQRYTLAKNYRYSLSAGFSSMTITGNNPNNTQYASVLENEYGGGFVGMQPGYGLLFQYSFDEKGQFKLPIGIDYINMRSASRKIYNDFSNLLYESITNNSYDLVSVYSGFNWFFYRLPSVNVNFFVGAELRGTFLSQGDFTREITYKDYKTQKIDSVVTASQSKSAVTRYGVDFKCGFEGEVKAPWFIHVAFGYGVLNMVGKDDSHGNLFVTKESPYKKEELAVNPFYFAFMIQYRF